MNLDNYHSNESVLGRHTQGLPDLFTESSIRTRPQWSVNGHAKTVLQEMEYICRICHGGDSSGDLITPCRCRGTIALAHLNCLEIWLNESNRNDCELCKYHFRIIRTPKYGVPRSIYMFLRRPGEHLRELLVDVVTLVVYTPSTITSTYMLMLLCESLAKSTPKVRNVVLSHAMAFTAIFAINFTYTSWLVLTMEKYYEYWKDWYRRHCTVKVILSTHKMKNGPINSGVDSSV